jgi:hypothetical protein
LEDLMSDDITRRISRWKVKADPDKVAALLRELKDDMTRRQEFEQARLFLTEVKARQVLDSANVPTILYVFYLNFAREIHNRAKRFSGPSLRREVDVLLEKWVARTLDRDILERIRDEAFSVAEPGP